jgi:hypothetical protein
MQNNYIMIAKQKLYVELMINIIDEISRFLHLNLLLLVSAGIDPVFAVTESTTVSPYSRRESYTIITHIVPQYAARLLENTSYKYAAFHYFFYSSRIKSISFGVHRVVTAYLARQSREYLQSSTQI